MAEYRKVEYRIGKNGKITEKVIDGTGENCLETTETIEKDLGKIENRELLPEYYENEDNINNFNENNQQIDRQ
ncbi:MAG: DUF2997 domain-containing protein [Prochloraceae cyanobacterium]|nr:DUF2997 domain-containing protein [Prochloraceae cyanobacterium]